MSEYRQGYNDGWERGWDRAAANLVPILTDLIAELRGYADDGYIMGASTMRELCTRVKEDLREVSGG